MRCALGMLHRGGCPWHLYLRRLFPRHQCLIGVVVFRDDFLRVCLGVANGGELDGTAFCHLPLHCGFRCAMLSGMADVVDFRKIALEDGSCLARVMASAGFPLFHRYKHLLPAS